MTTQYNFDSSSSGARPIRRKNQENNHSNHSRHGGRMSGAMMAAMIVLLLGSGTDPRGGMVAAFSSSPAGRTRSTFSPSSSFTKNAIFNHNNYNNNNFNCNNIKSNHLNNRHAQHPSRSTRLHAATATASALSQGPLSLAALAALTSTIGGGLVSGSLHAIAGPDHLAALIPRCCGLPWHKAARVGAVWGLGHGVSATLLGVCGFLFKKGVRLTGLLGGGWSAEKFNLLHHAGSFMELAIGASLIVIGLLGIKEARDFVVPEDQASVCDVQVDMDENTNENANAAPQSLSSAATPPATAAATRPNPAKRAVLFNGILHGFSWDGAPSLAPAVAIATWRGSLAFLLSYAVGTMAAMTVATTLIGEGTRRASFHLDRPDLPKDLSVASSFLALIVGVVWCWLALK